MNDQKCLSMTIVNYEINNRKFWMTAQRYRIDKLWIHNEYGKPLKWIHRCIFIGIELISKYAVGEKEM